MSAVIKTWGRNLNSTDPERRALYISTHPQRGTPAESFFYAVQRILSHLSSLSQSSADPWWLHRKCEHCEATARRYFNMPWLPTHHIYDKWKTGYCLRHGILMHNDLFSISNKERVVAVDGDVLQFRTATNKYSVEFTLYRDHADVVIVKEDSYQVVFTYKNHEDSGPYASAYEFLVRRIREFTMSLIDAVVSCRYKVYINGRPVCPPNQRKA
jgi:hypothetical protein